MFLIILQFKTIHALQALGHMEGLWKYLFSSETGTMLMYGLLQTISIIVSYHKCSDV